MSLKMRSLGLLGSAARGILITSGTNATPIVATVTAGHRLKDGDRIGIVGVTTLTNMNGDWEVQRVTDTTYKLLGSKGNGAFGGTAVVAVCCDRTPFMPRHSAVATFGQQSGGAVLVGTVVFEGADMHKSDESNFQYTNSSGVATDGFTSALMSGEVAIPAASAGIGGFSVEVSLMRYMTARCSAYTSGGAQAYLMA